MTDHQFIGFVHTYTRHKHMSEQHRYDLSDFEVAAHNFEAYMAANLDRYGQDDLTQSLADLLLLMRSADYGYGAIGRQVRDLYDRLLILLADARGSGRWRPAPAFDEF